MPSRERAFYDAALSGHLAGTEEQVAAALADLLRETGAQEILVTTSTYDRDALYDSYRRLAQVVRADETVGP
jgi:alkanesulfonate monooxygenase SsuD/methylene tetrahydromethanopterin reductase-like flavin-dependent oxidoreductase (luciferase family)